ncbi:MAG: 2-oxoglutarate and iron-dependent oxygenase domain-containing protein [Halioglobus sp.]
MQHIPTIDFASLDNTSTRDSLDSACREWGFFYLTGHGIDSQATEQMQTSMQHFFALPLAQKQKVERTADNPWGFYNRELTKNVRDWKEIFDIGPDLATQGLSSARAQWPDESDFGLLGFRSAVTTFSAACEAVALRLLQAISQNLGMPALYLNDYFGADHTSFLRLNYYPPCPSPAPADAPHNPLSGHLGISHHTDSGAITVLLQDTQPGLQVWHKAHWHLIAPREDALVINIGDIVQVWSNDRYRAPLHRVLAHSSTPRYSAPYFCNPGYDTVYEPLPGTCDSTQPPRYRPISWGEFRAARAAGDYADQGEEVQISDYRICAN